MRVNIFRRTKRAVCGLFSVVIRDTSVRLMAFIGIGVIAAAFWLNINKIEFVVVLVIAFSVVILEGVNTILEQVIDLVEPRYKEMVREIKDALAGFVLLASIGAAVVGTMIFWPYLAEKFL